jgi:large subunit ribosomal protein L21
MQATMQIGGRQITAKEGEIIRVDTRDVAAGGKLTIDQVLLVKSDSGSSIGAPYVNGAKVEAEVVSHGLGEKVRAFRYKRRTKARKTLGHRQGYTDLKITKIVAPKG